MMDEGHNSIIFGTSKGEVIIRVKPNNKVPDEVQEGEKISDDKDVVECWKFLRKHGIGNLLNTVINPILLLEVQ